MPSQATMLRHVTIAPTRPTSAQALVFNATTQMWTPAAVTDVGAVHTGDAAGGDLAGTYPNPTLGTTGPGATGPLGSATVVPVVTIDAKGRVTGLTSTTIAIPESAVTNLTTDLGLKAPIASPTFTGITTAPEFSASGLTGSVQATRWVGATTSGAPATGAHVVGDFVTTQDGHIFICTVAATPGTFVDAGGMHSGDAIGPWMAGTAGSPRIGPDLSMSFLMGGI